MNPESPLGPRQLDFGQLDPSDFEAFCHRLVHAAHPRARRLRAPDRGADSLLPAFDGGAWVRAWQYKRFGDSAVNWRQCEKSFDDAVDNYGVRHVTFCFPHDLTGGRELEFERRFAGRREGVLADWWGMTELHAQAEATSDGRRAVRWAFGPSAEEERDAIFEAAALGGELEAADDVLGRLRALGRWLARRDEYFAYTAHVWEAGQPQPDVPSGTVMSVLELGDDVRERVDAVYRDPEGMDAAPVGGRIIFEPNEAGHRAHEAFLEAKREGRPLRIEEGVSWAFDSLPSLFSDDLGEVEPLALVIGPLPTDPPPTMHASLRIERGERETLDVELEGLSAPRSMQQLSWQGRYPGIELTLSLRKRPEGGGETSVDATSKLSETAPIRDQLKALRFMRALHGPGELLIVDRARPEHRLAIPLSDRGTDEQLDGLIAVLQALTLIEDWSSERLTLPRELDSDQAKEILGLAAGLRAGGWPVEIGDIHLPADQAAVTEDSAYVLQQEVGYRLLGRELWLGVMTVNIPDVELVESAVPGKAVVRSRRGSPVRLPGVLRPGTLASVAPPAHFESLPADHNLSGSRSTIEEEVRHLAVDVEDSRERRAVMADMEAVTSDWPE